jgi:hypothetical protein
VPLSRGVQARVTRNLRSISFAIGSVLQVASDPSERQGLLEAHEVVDVLVAGQRQISHHVEDEFRVLVL